MGLSSMSGRFCDTFSTKSIKEGFSTKSIKEKTLAVCKFHMHRKKSIEHLHFHHFMFDGKQHQTHPAFKV